MKNILTFLFLSAAVISSCTKEYNYDPNANNNTGNGNNGGNSGGNNSSYGSLKDFHTANEVKPQSFSGDIANGIFFTTAAGTQVAIPPNAFVTLSGDPVTGQVDIQFKDIYRKSDMLLSQKPTMLASGGLLKSGGEFWIKATSNGLPVQIAPGYVIAVSQPLYGLPYDTDMDAFMLDPNSNWISATNAQVMDTSGNLSAYETYLYQFVDGDSGTWINCDNPNFFSGYTPTEITFHPDFNVTGFTIQMYLLYTGVNAAMYIYPSGGNFVQDNCPIGLSCTAVAIGVKDSTFYSSFIPITISANMNLNFNLSQTTDSLFLESLRALD